MPLRKINGKTEFYRVGSGPRRTDYAVVKLRISGNCYQRAARIANERKVSISTVVRAILESALQEE